MKWLLGAVLIVLVALLVAAAWLVGTEPGLQWVAARAQAAAEGKLTLEGVRGALARDISISALKLPQVEMRNVALRIELLAFLGRRAGIRYLRAQSLEVTLGPGDDKPLSAPDLAFGLRIDSADIERISVQRGEERYVIEEFQLRDAFVRESGAIAASLSFALRHEEYPATVRLKLAGTLNRVDALLEGAVRDVPVKATALITAFSGRPLEAIDAEAGPLDLSKLNAEWPRTLLSVKLTGKTNEGRLSVRNAVPGALDAERIPISALDTRFATDFKTLSLDELKIVLTPAGTLAGKGTLSAGQAAFELRAADLDLRSFRQGLRRTQLSGPLRLNASEKAQSVQGTLAQADMSITADVVRAGDVLEVRSLRAASAGGEASGSARLRLAEPMSFETRLKLAHFDPARFGEYPSGDINGAVDAAGALGKNLRVDARWLIRDSTLEGEALTSRGAARIGRGRVTQANVDATLGGARLTARGDFGRRGDELALELEAPRIDHFVGGVEGSLRASGRLTGSFGSPQGSLTARAIGLRLPNGIALKSVTAKASGTLVNHSGEILLQAEGLELDARLRGGWKGEAGWSGEIQALRNSGRYPMQLTAPAPLRVAPGRVELGRLDAALADGRLLVKELAWSEGRLASSGEFSGLPAQWLLLAAGHAERVRSTLLVDGHWSLGATPRLTGTLSLRRASGDLTLTQGGPRALGLEKALLDARFTDGRVAASADILSRYASVVLKADITPEPNAPGMGITAESALSFEARVAFVDLRVLTQPLLADARLDGRIGAELRGSGTLARPSIAGSLRGDAIAFEMPPYGVFLKNGELRATLEGETVRITEFSIHGGEGRLSASGTLPLRFAQGGASMTWRAEKFGLMERPDLRLVASGSGEAKLENGRVALSGALRADRGYLELEQERLPKLGDDVVIIGQQRARAKESARLPVALDVQLDLGEQLEVRGYGLEGKLAGRLQVETTKEGELRVYGRVHTVNATFLAYGHRLQVDPGVAIFDGPLDNPALQMTAWRRNQQVEAGVQVSGTARAPRVQLVSQPPVSEGERLSWLVLGRPPGDATKADLGLLQAAAGALLARDDQMPLDRRLAKAFGVDEISLRGSGEVADRVVAVGKRLSDRLYISYEQGLGAAASALVKLDFSLTQRLSLRAETGTSSGIGLFYRFSWD
jgi:translocation and assembly module TamB